MEWLGGVMCLDRRDRVMHARNDPIRQCSSHETYDICERGSGDGDREFKGLAPVVLMSLAQV